MNATSTRGVSHIAVSAALSVAILVSAAGMQLGKTYATPLPIDPSTLEPATPPAYVEIEDTDANGVPDWQDELARAGVALPAVASSSVLAATSSDPLAEIGSAVVQSIVGGYLSLKQYDAYTPERGEQLAGTIADSLRAPEIFEPHTVEELLLDEDTSASRVQRYRNDMRFALEPLISDEEYELTLFAAYLETRDQAWLDRLAKSAVRYRAAEKNILALRIPKDAAPEHLRLANALGAFANTLERMTQFANDPFASAALLRTYNDAERDFDLAFDGLIKYYARTIGDN